MSHNLGDLLRRPLRETFPCNEFWKQINKVNHPEASLVDADRPFSAARHANRGYSPDDVVQLHTIDIANIFMELVNGLIVRHFVKLDTLGCLTVGNRPLASNLIT